MDPDELLLFQARYVLRSLDVDRPGAGYGKMADACKRVALKLYNDRQLDDARMSKPG